LNIALVLLLPAPCSLLAACLCPVPSLSSLPYQHQMAHLNYNDLESALLKEQREVSHLLKEEISSINTIIQHHIDRDYDIFKLLELDPIKQLDFTPEEANDLVENVSMYLGNSIYSI
jgi:hypothetical protein